MAARPPPHARTARPLGGSAAHPARGYAQRWRGDAARAAEAAHATAQDAAADRRLRLDEGALGGQPAPRAYAVAGGAECRSVHLQHSPDAGDAGAAAETPR